MNGNSNDVTATACVLLMRGQCQLGTIIATTCPMWRKYVHAKRLGHHCRASFDDLKLQSTLMRRGYDSRWRGRCLCGRVSRTIENQGRATRVRRHLQTTQGLVVKFLAAVYCPSDDHAAGSGVRVERVKALTFCSAALLTGGCVAVAGSVGFVGLVVPHSVRLIGVRDARLSVPLSALAGASFLVLVDLASRAFGELPVGVVTASLGAPFFLWLLARRRAS